MDVDAPLLGAPQRRAASSASLFLELTRVHPLLHVGAALLAITALTAMLSGGVVLVTVLAPTEPALNLPLNLPDWAISSYREAIMTPQLEASSHALLIRLGMFGLNVLTTAVVAYPQLQDMYERCALKPCLKRATLLGGLAGLVVIAWSTLLAVEPTPLAERAELASLFCTLAYSLLLSAWNGVCSFALSEWTDGDEPEALDAAADDCGAGMAVCYSARRAAPRRADEELIVVAMCSLVLSIVTIIVGAALLRCEIGACERPPTVHPALVVSGLVGVTVAGVAVISFMLLFRPGMLGAHGLIESVHDADDAAADETEAQDVHIAHGDDAATAKLAAKLAA